MPRINDGVTNHNPIDIHVGQRIRLRRSLLGMSQEQLGDAINITFQQVQKYERGANRVSASRLWDIGQILDVPVSFFFDDMGAETQAASPRAVLSGGTITVPDNAEANTLLTRRTLELARALQPLPEPVQQTITDMVKAMSRHFVAAS